MSTPRCYNFYGGSILISKHQKIGTLLDLVNLTKTGDKNIIEPLAIYLVAELLGKWLSISIYVFHVSYFDY